jgi:hypothetical protein
MRKMGGGPMPPRRTVRNPQGPYQSAALASSKGVNPSDEVVPMLASHLNSLNAEIRSLAVQSRTASGRTNLSSRASPPFANAAEVDIEALAFIVMMAAASSAQQDLQAIMNGIKEITAIKDVERQVIDQVNSMSTRLRKLRVKRPW